MVKTAASIATGRRNGWRLGLRSMNGSRNSRTMQMVGTPIVAMNTSAGGLITRSSSNRKKKYHSGRGGEGGVVGSAFGPSSAPSTIDITMMTSSTMQAIKLSFRIA